MNKVTKIVLGLSTLLLAAGCSSFNGDFLRVMEPPMENIDTAETSANLLSGQGMYVGYGYESVDPNDATTVDGEASLTVGTFKEIANFGAGMASAENALNELADNNRRLRVKVFIGDSEHAQNVAISDNASQMEPGDRSMNVSLDLETTEPEIIVTNIIETPEVIEAPEIPEAPESPEEPETPPTSEIRWRTDEGTILANGEVVRFRTRNVQDMVGSAGDGGCEHIIARIVGSGFTRVLLMDMCGNRQSRIFVEGPNGGEFNGKFPLPLDGVHRWVVASSEGTLVVLLDGEEIFNVSGDYQVEAALMGGGYGNRSFTGEWSEVL